MGRKSLLAVQRGHIAESSVKTPGHLWQLQQETGGGGRTGAAAQEWQKDLPKVELRGPPAVVMRPQTSEEEASAEAEM